MKEQQTSHEGNNQMEGEQPSEWYGQIKFKPSMNYQKAKNFILPIEENVILEKWWMVDCSQAQPNWSYLFMNTDECHARSISFLNVDKILLPIMVPSYVLLVTLDLSNNQLKNIEFLSMIDTPRLVTLNLSGNVITVSKALNKMALSNPSQLGLDNNPLQSVEVSRIFVKTTMVKKVRVFDVQYESTTTTEPRFFDKIRFHFSSERTDERSNNIMKVNVWRLQDPNFMNSRERQRPAIVMANQRDRGIFRRFLNQPNFVVHGDIAFERFQEQFHRLP